MADGKFSGRLTSSTVRLCVDMQRLFSTEGPWPTPWMDKTLPKIVEVAELQPDKTIFTRFIPPLSPAEMSGTRLRYYKEWRHVCRDRLDPALLDLVTPLQRISSRGTRG